VERELCRAKRALAVEPSEKAAAVVEALERELRYLRALHS
jgi:hypothetical protein